MARSGAGLAVALCLLLAVPAASADWLMAGHDARRSSIADGAGPSGLDTVYSVPLNTSFNSLSYNIVVHDGDVWVTNPRDNLNELWRLRVPTNEKEVLGPFEAGTDADAFTALFGDAESLFMTHGDRIMQVPWGSTEAREILVRPVAEEPDGADLIVDLECPFAVVVEAFIYAACFGWGTEEPPHVVAIDLDSGNVVWRQPAGQPFGTSTAGDPDLEHPAITNVLNLLSGPPVDNSARFRSLSVIDGFLTYTTVSTGATGTDAPTFEVAILDRSNGVAAWTVRAGGDYSAAATGDFHCDRAPGVAGHAGQAFFTTTGIIWKTAVGEGRAGDGQLIADCWTPSSSNPGDMAFDRHRLIFGHEGDMLALNTTHMSFEWGWSLPEGQTWWEEAPIVAGDRIFAVAQSVGGTILYVLDASDGRPIMQRAWGPEVIDTAVDGDYWYIRDVDRLSVVGIADFGIKVDAKADTYYPSTDGSLRVDLGGSLGGNQGELTAYRVEWGDGTIDDWQESPVFTHRYADDLNMRATFWATNGNQVGSADAVFKVGQHDPAVTIWNSPFDPEFQETTFFFLGIVATALLAAIGVYRAGRKRRRLHHELRALEAAFRQLESQPKECEAMLAEHRTRAKSLFLSRKLEEAHSSFLVSRIDELRRTLRLGTVESRLKFLPYGMVLHLERLLVDAHIDEYEREHFQQALDAEPSLSAKQRAEARRLIDGWFARDASINEDASKS